MNKTFTYNSNFYLTQAMACIDSSNTILRSVSKNIISLALQKCSGSDKDDVRNFGVKLCELCFKLSECSRDICNRISDHDDTEEKSSKTGSIIKCKNNFGCEINYLKTALQRALPFLQAELVIAEKRFNTAEPMRERSEKINTERHGEYVRTNDAKYNKYKYAGIAAGEERYRITQEIKAVNDLLSHLDEEI